MTTIRPNSTSGVVGTPLGGYPGEFRCHLEGQHYRRATIAEYTRCIDALGQLMKERGVDIKDLDEDLAVSLISSWERPLSQGKYPTFIVKSFVKFLTDLGAGRPVLPPTIDDTARELLKRDYEDYLRNQRGLSERTIGHCWRFADRFLKFRFNGEEADLSRITSIDIVRFMQHLTSRGKPFRDKTPPTHLRNFFQYLFKSGKTAANLALGIPSIAQRYGARLPRHLNPEQVESLIRAVRADTPIGRRNYAMVLLLARLGQRAPEVIAMQIDDIDWRAGEILVRGKGQTHDRVPLPQDVGEALADYVRRDRVTTSRALFVTEPAPHIPFSDGQILNAVLKDAFAKTGLTPPMPYVGSHILRHSLATTLVQRGASLEEIGDMLRHRSRASTLIYAKLDIEGLRSIAQPWPVAGGAK